MLSHMLFVNDSYLYCKASNYGTHKILELLDVFEMGSGQKVNIDNSSVCTYSNNLVCQVMLMNEAKNHKKYLGLPNMLGRNKSTIIGFLR